MNDKTWRHDRKIARHNIQNDAMLTEMRQTFFLLNMCLVTLKGDAFGQKAFERDANHGELVMEREVDTAEPG